MRRPGLLLGKTSVRMKVGGDDKNDVKYNDFLVSTLGNFLPGGSGTGKSQSGTKLETELDRIDWAAPKARGLSMEALAKALESGLRKRSWFVTGNIMPELFSDNFSFKDPNVKLEGVEAYARGVNKVFNQKTSRMQVCTHQTIDEHSTWQVSHISQTSSVLLTCGFLCDSHLYESMRALAACMCVLVRVMPDPK